MPAHRAEWLKTGRESARIATALNAKDSMAHAVYGLGLLNWGEHEAGVRETTLAAGRDLVRALPDAVFGYRHCMAALVRLGRMEEASDYADIIYSRFPRELTFFLGTIWGEWRPQDHAAYAEILAAGGLVLRDGVLHRIPGESAP